MTAQQVNSNAPLALVIGATGGIGGHVARVLVDRGWRVRALSRDPAGAAVTAAWIGAVEWIAGDAMRETDAIAAATGADVIVHAANPPQYRNWRGLVLPMLANALAAARVSGARLVLPGNIYNFGPDAWPLVTEKSPQNPATRKGAVRVEMEQMLIAAAVGGVRSLAVRAGDFFGPHQPASWFRDVFVKPGKPVRSVIYPGRHDIGHAWAYLPDLAETIVRLIEVEATLAPIEVFNFGGHWLDRGIEIAHAIQRVAGMQGGRVRSFPWLLLRFAWPFMPLARELLEMRYLWQVPVRLDNSKLVALIGSEPHTPLDAAVRETLKSFGCLDRGAETEASDPRGPVSSVAATRP